MGKQGGDLQAWLKAASRAPLRRRAGSASRGSSKAGSCQTGPPPTGAPGWEEFQRWVPSGFCTPCKALGLSMRGKKGVSGNRRKCLEGARLDDWQAQSERRAFPTLANQFTSGAGEEHAGSHPLCVTRHCRSPSLRKMSTTISMGVWSVTVKGLRSRMLRSLRLDGELGGSGGEWSVK